MAATTARRRRADGIASSHHDAGARYFRAAVPEGNIEVDPDSYSSIHGSALIVELRQPDPYSYTLPDGIEVLFDFTPDDAEAPSRYRYPEVGDRQQRLTVGAGANPPLSWVHAMELLPGTRHRCVRHEALRGVGPPVLFSFPGLDTATVWSRHA